LKLELRAISRRTPSKERTDANEQDLRPDGLAPAGVFLFLLLIPGSSETPIILGMIPEGK